MAITYDSFKEKVFDNLTTTDSTLYFIKNFENFLNDRAKEDTIKGVYTFMKEYKLEEIEVFFPKLRSDLLSRKKIKIQTPIIVSNNLINMIYNTLSKDTSKYMLDFVLDTSIVSGLKITIDGNLIDLTLESLNKGKF